ncbi:hypothetical protein GCM10010967_48390 [Dyadobacter beijingensis]|uniref:Ig-like domain-containing protein n=1 Tax=Dyadobacter beijingensis TaxID=365489 RepID=A0ABQ2IG97_9BACT|nr:hypothetical protein GCM10010967_48390 [Dyadobacter beijingensis]
MISTSITTATCPSNGAFTVNATAGTGATYQITSGPVGFPTGAQSSSTFEALLPGTYTVKVACSDDPNVFTTTTVVVPTSYVQVAASSVAADVCVGAGAGGVINTTITAGSASPYSYAYWVGDPAENDQNLTYQVQNTTSLTDAHAVPAFGNYNVRVKDACGVFITREVTVTRDIPENLCVTSARPRRDGMTCAELLTSIKLELTFSSLFSALPYGKSIDVEFYENTGTCASPVQGALIKTETYDNTSPFYPTVIVPNFINLLIVTKTPCGDVCTYCYDYGTSYQAVSINFSIQPRGCPASPSDPIPYSINISGGVNYVLPVTFTIKNSLGIDIAGSPYVATTEADLWHEFPNLPPDTYTVDGTDACGAPLSATLNSGTGTPVPLALGSIGGYAGCTTIEGRTTMSVYISGEMANYGNAVATIVAGPNLVGVAGVNRAWGVWEWPNAIPGATYTIEVNNLCGQTEQVTVTLPLSVQTLDQHTTATAEQLCGGTGNIVIAATNNGYGTFSFDVKNSANVTVGTGTVPGITISNLPPDTYTVNSHMIGCGPYDYSSQVEILPAGQGPVITKKIGIICEDANGDLTSTGNALLAFTGAKPLKFEYRLTSGTDADYVTLTGDSDGTETISGLTPYTSYTIRVTDNCGNSTVTQVTIGKLDPVKVENTLQPCAGSSYALSVPDMVDATYTWTKDGVTVSNQRSISFNPYQASDDGTYVCTINILGGCVTRVTTVQLSSTHCNQPLPVTLVSFEAAIVENKAVLTWKTTNEKDFSHFEIERGSTATSFSPIGHVDGNAGGRYSFVDKETLSDNQYYRLKMVDNDGTYAYSRIRSLNFNRNSSGVYPNPASDFLMVNARLSKTMKSVELVSANGSTVYKTTNVPASGINVSKFAQGIYLIKIKSRDGSEHIQKVFIAR